MKAVYPVGSMYINALDPSLPDTLAAIGTWERRALGRSLVGYDPANAEYDTVGDHIGQKTIDLNHSHTVSSHNHSVPVHKHTLGGGRALVWVSDSTGRVFTSPVEHTRWNNITATGTSTPYTEAPPISKAVKLEGTTDNSAAANTGNATPGTNSQLSSTQNIEGPGEVVVVWCRVA